MFVCLFLEPTFFPISTSPIRSSHNAHESMWPHRKAACRHTHSTPTAADRTLTQKMGGPGLYNTWLIVTLAAALWPVQLATQLCASVLALCSDRVFIAVWVLTCFLSPQSSCVEHPAGRCSGGPHPNPAWSPSAFFSSPKS